MTTTKDIYWLAGLLEGEGSFSLDRKYPRIQVKMNDRDVVIRALSILKPVAWQRRGNSIIEFNDHHRLGTGHPYFMAVLSGGRAAGWMMTLYPLMGERRQRQIRKALAGWRSFAGRGPYGLKNAA